MLAKKYRFHGYGSLKYLYQNGKTVRAKSCSLKTIHNPKRENSRVSIVVGKKVSKKAPVRNRIRRRLYEAIRMHWAMLKPNHDMVITVFDDSPATAPPEEINRIVAELLTKANLYKD